MRFFHAPLIVLVFLFSCKTPPIRRELRKVNQLATLSPSHKFIKAHMSDGKVFILNTWKIDTTARVVHGYGSHLDLNRKVISNRLKASNASDPVHDGFHVPIDGIALIESNDTGRSLLGPMTVVTGVTAGLTIYCLTNPKACFGSCPTFYASDGDTLTVQAEGFSTSVSPSLERRDIDMLYHAVPEKDFTLVLTNEALETHCIRHANLMVFPITPNESVYATEEGGFFRCSEHLSPLSFITDDGENVEKVSKADGLEYFSLTDNSNIESKEWVTITFDVPRRGQYGLVIGKRQTLLTTFLMYQGLSYMGHSVTYWMAEMERGNVKKQPGIFQLLGGIDVFSADEKAGLIPHGSVNETGPIATDFNVVPIGDVGDGKLTLKLKMNRGLWRIDQVSLVSLNGSVVPESIEPSAVDVIRGSEKDPLGKLLSADQYLVTYPGDAYRIKYKLPYDTCSIFLDSKGYYLEWIRDEWVKEQSLVKLSRMIKHPAKYLQSAASQYKLLEPSMEDAFWKSRYEKN
jgi:hypothetical protein